MNFITGAGGFLQSALFGSSGMRLTQGGLTFNPPPPSASGGAATMMGIRVTYRGSILSRRVVSGGGNGNDTVITQLLSSRPGAPQLFHVDKQASPPKVTALKVGQPLTHPRGKSVITIESNASHPL